jgi:hypothetical protein
MAPKKQSYNNKTDAHKWRTEIPNVVFDMGLSLSAVCLYGYIKRKVAYKRKFWKSISTLAKESGMSHNLVVKAKKELVKLGLIKVVEIKSQYQGGASDMIIMTDIKTGGA